MSTELVSVESLQPVDIFKAEKVTELLKKVEARIKDFVPDVETAKGREKIKSFAFQIVKSKTLLDGIGKDYVAAIKEEPKRIDAERKRIRDTLDRWAEEVRRPVTEIEEKEKARVAKHEADLLEITQLSVFVEDLPTVETILSRVERWKQLTSKDWEEFKDRSSDSFAKAHEILLKKLESRKKYDAEQAELEELRKQKALQDQKDRDAKLVADALAAADEKKKQDADKAFQAVNEPAALAPVSATVSKAAESVKIATSPQTPTDPKAAINREAMLEFVKNGFSEADAKKIVVLIATGKIPKIAINYGEK
jgi:hypothetical protein